MIEDAASGTVEERLRNRIGRNRPQCFQSLAQALVGTIGHGSGAVGTRLGNALGSAFTKIVGEEFSLMVSITTDRTWSGVKTGWTWISDHVFSPLKAGLRGVKDYFSDRYDDIKDVWSNLRTKLHDGWTWISKYVFAPFKTGIAAIKTAFSNAKKGIAHVWDELKNAVAKPVKFIVNTVYTDGIQSWWNKLAKSVHVKGVNLPDVKLGFAGGGVMPGYTPGRDVHSFYSPTAGRLDLSGGEAIMRPEWTRAVGGPRAVAQMNAAAKSGRAFKDGGVIDNITDWLGSTWSKTWHGIVGHFGNPLSKLSQIGGGNFGKIVGALPRLAVTGLKDTLKGLFSGGGGGTTTPGSLGSLGGGAGSWTGPGMGWKKMWALVHAAIPGAVLTSAFRPGAIAAGTGLPSMHSLGRAIDVGGSPLVMHQVFEWVKSHFPNSKEIIHSQEGLNQVYKGRPFLYPEPTRSAHFNHTHWGFKDGGTVAKAKLYDNGGYLPTGTTVVQNNTGKPEPVFTPEQLAKLGTGVHIENLVVRDERAAFQEAEAANRRTRIRSGLSRR